MVWQPGESGNNQGLKRTKPLTDALRAILTRDSTESLKVGHKVTNAQAIALKLVEMALDGEPTAIKECFDRLEGKAMQMLEVKKADPFENLSADDVIAFRDRLNRTRPVVTIAGTGIEIPQIGALQALQEAT